MRDSVLQAATLNFSFQLKDSEGDVSGVQNITVKVNSTGSKSITRN